MAKNISELCYEKFVPIIEELGYELVCVEYQKIAGEYNMTFFISNNDGITLEDCEKVHKTIDPILDDLNPTNDAHYVLNVSSVGLDRPLKTQKDFERNIGKEIQIKLYVPFNKSKEHSGKLIAFDNDSVEIENEQGKFKFELKKIGNIVPLLKI